MFTALGKRQISLKGEGGGGERGTIFLPSREALISLSFAVTFRKVKGLIA